MHLLEDKIIRVDELGKPSFVTSVTFGSDLEHIEHTRSSSPKSNLDRGQDFSGFQEHKECNTANKSIL